MDNFLSASDLIIARLRDSDRVNVPERNVRSAPSAEWAIANAHDACLSVIFFDDQPDMANGGVRKNGKGQVSLQYWLILISVKNVADAAGDAARKSGGELMLQVLQALQGYRLSLEHGELYRQRIAYKNTDKNGFVHIPLLFATRIVTEAI